MLPSSSRPATLSMNSSHDTLTHPTALQAVIQYLTHISQHQTECTPSVAGLCNFLSTDCVLSWPLLHEEGEVLGEFQPLLLHRCLLKWRLETVEKLLLNAR